MTSTRPRLAALCLAGLGACALDASGTGAGDGAGGATSSTSTSSGSATSGNGTTTTTATSSSTASGGECTEGAPCDTGQVGPCAAGTWSCGGGSPSCVATTGPNAETCNGLDDDCNGVVDDAVAAVGTACATGGVGACGTGVWACEAGVSVCQPASPTTESCNGIDDDCNGAVDDLPRAAVAQLPGTNVDGISLAGGADFVTVHPGESFSVHFQYYIKDPCQYCGCIDQLLVGFPGDTPQTCAYDGTPGCGPGAYGTYDGAIQAPAAPGAYAIQFGFSQQYDCILDWGTAGSVASAGSVCVVP